MDKIIRNVSDFEITEAAIQGSQPKILLKDKNHKYMLKFPEAKQNGAVIPYHISEYVSCDIVRRLGYSAQDVELVIYKSRIGALVELFDKQLITFTGFGSSTLSHEKLNYDLWFKQNKK